MSALLLAASLAACESDPTRVPVGTETPIVQAVLNPAMSEQWILLEQTLTGRVDATGANDPDAEEPILMGGGVPIEGAYVVVYNELGDSAIAPERRTDPGDIYHAGGGGKGSGVYVFFSYPPPRQSIGDPPPGPYYMPLSRGGRYSLIVRSPFGQLFAETTIPDADATTVLRDTTFNRDHDSLTLNLPPARLAWRYSVNIQTPEGPYELFTDDLHYRIRGGLRNASARRRPRAFVPGFQQVITIAAVDSNYFDFFRTSNDTITGRGLIEHVQGGIGVFGAFSPLDRVTITVVADVDEPIEGRYVEDGTGKSLTLYVNERSSALTQLSGSYGFVGGSTTGVLGQLDGTSMSLVFVAAQTLSDTLYTLQGRLVNETIVGLRSDGAVVGFRKVVP